MAYASASKAGYGGIGTLRAFCALTFAITWGLIGAVWAIWHLPVFHLAGVVFAEWSFLPFFVGSIVLAILVTPIINAARGSRLIPVPFHGQLINPFGPDAQPQNSCTLVGVATLIVWWSRETMFKRGRDDRDHARRSKIVISREM